jgi:2-methylcitrate dehydratase PrpD
MAASGDTLIATLAAFVADARASDLPPDMAQKATWHILDTVGAALAGSTSDEARLTAAALAAAEGSGDAGLWGTDRALSPRSAALVNGIAAHAFELDDTGGCDHSGAVVLPALVAALPLAEQPVEGRDLLLATAIGYDIGRRILMGFGGYVPHNQAGWHSTGTCGVFGAAAAVASLLRLDAERTGSCLGLAASFASGLWAFIHDGAMAKRVHAGRAAEGGLLAALLARGGVTGPGRALDDVWGGFFRTYGHAPLSPEAVTTDLGRDWLLRDAAIKPHASCRDTHAAIDALGRVLRREHLRTEDVASVEARLNGFLHGMVGGRDASTMAAAQMSLPYSLAARLCFGTAGLSAYSEPRRGSPEIAAAMERITVTVDEAITASWASSISVTTRDGRRIEEPTTTPLGSPENPFAPEELRAKYDGLAQLVLPTHQADELAETVLALPDLRHARALLPLLRASGAPPSAGPGASRDPVPPTAGPRLSPG